MACRMHAARKRIQHLDLIEVARPVPEHGTARPRASAGRRSSLTAAEPQSRCWSPPRATEASDDVRAVSRTRRP